MFVTIVLNTEYMDIASRSKWYLKCLLHCKQNGWILISHEYMKTHIGELQKEITPSLFDSWEMQPFELKDVEDVEQYYIPDAVFKDLEKTYGSRSETLFALNSEDNPLLRKSLSCIFDEIKRNHPKEKIDGIFNALESFESIRCFAKELQIPLINYSFSAIRKPHGYRQTLYHANHIQLWNSQECSERWPSFESENREKIPVFTNKEIIAIIGKERTLPLLQLMDSTPKYEMGICCEFYSLIPQVFSQNKYTDDDIFYECKKLYTKDKIKVRSHSLHLDDIQVDRTEVRNDPASFILSCKRLTAVQSQIMLKVMMWNRTAIMKKHTLAFSYLCSKDYESNEKVNLVGLNYYIFGYLIPSDLIYSDEYWKWRLTCPSETEIYQRHLDFLFNELNIDKTKLMQLKGKERFRFLLECRHCDEQLIKNLMSDEVVDNVNWDVASSRFDIVSDLETKSYWRIDTTNENNDLTTNLAVDIKNAKTIMFYPLDDVAGFARLKTVYINGKQQVLDETTTSFKYMPKTKGAYSFKLDNPYSGKLLVECIWEYKKVFEFLNN